MDCLRLKPDLRSKKVTNSSLIREMDEGRADEYMARQPKLQAEKFHW